MFQSTVTCMFLEVGGHTLLLFPETESFKSKFRDIKEKKKRRLLDHLIHPLPTQKCSPGLLVVCPLHYSVSQAVGPSASPWGDSCMVQ